MRLLLTGDIHIGRSSTCTADIAEARTLAASAAWDRIVELALEADVDVLCLSGDVADQENKFWEAIGPIEHGVQRLSEAGILTVAVSGNHDYDVLRRVADQVPKEAFCLLGRGGLWERTTIERGGRSLHVDGWSFPREKVATSPLSTYDLDDDPSTPTLGLIHGDLDVAGSSYAPLDTYQLRSLPVDGWLLGHIHAPRLMPEKPWILYPGSPQALDFGEPGLHGVWMVDVDHALAVPEQRSLSATRYEALTIDVSEAEAEADVESLILNQIRASSEAHVEESGAHLEYLALRLTITGRTPLSHRIADITSTLRDDLSLRIGGVLVVVDRLSVATLPDIDINAYAKARSAPGAVARLLLALEHDEGAGDGPGEIAELVGRTKRELEANEDHKYFAALTRREITDEMARQHLMLEARALLTALVAQTS